METFNPEQISRLIALVVIAIAGIDLGVSFLMRSVSESSPDHRD